MNKRRSTSERSCPTCGQDVGGAAKKGSSTGSAASAGRAAREPGAGGRRRRRTKRSKRKCVQHEFRWAGALIGYRCVHCREIDPSPKGQFH